ncbi:regulator of nonsense transcripts UPF3-like [Impatiens glandulifera]|uniref:regulator of nonsense transcripts UPF3-like n=1 Tax=Impatiens glandulifera TaxID=253017 RepID=UPI001FB1A1E1|nr:regulator of nonsense transcripts UPF3-like [Impatiens glandulifera]
MKGPPDRTKVVVRHLPPTITQDKFMEQVDGRFAGRYNSISFFPGKNSQTHQSDSRAYMDFKKADDVIDFADFFNGHIFVNEKGTQFKSIVEYAPSQRLPKQWSKKDGREGSIYKDPEFLEFLEFIAKPVENLPSAEIQLERREAERSGAAKDSPIITPLMNFIRQRRAAKSGNRRSLPNGKLHRKAAGPSSAPSRRSSDRKKTSTSMYVQKDTAKSTGRKDKPTYILLPKRDDQVQPNKAAIKVTASGAEISEGQSGTLGTGDTGKRKILLLKGKEKEIPHSNTSPAKDSFGSTAVKSNLQSEAGGRIIRSILLNKDARTNTLSQSPSHVQPDQHTQDSSVDRDKRPPRPPYIQSSIKDTREGKVFINDLHGFPNEKQGKRIRNRERPDRGVWTPLRRSDGSHASDESLSPTTTTQSTHLQSEFNEGYQGEVKTDVSRGVEEGKSVGSGNRGRSMLDNGSIKHIGRRGMLRNVKDADAPIGIEGKLLKRGLAYGSHEKQAWVQKSGSGS